MQQALTAARVRALDRLRGRFDADGLAEKSARLDDCADRALTDPRAVLRYHETLLHMAAYPQSRAQLASVSRELERIAAAGAALHRSRGGASALASQGLAGGTIEAAFSLRIIEWLLQRGDENLQLEWHDGSAGSDLDDFLMLGLLPAERDGRLHPRFDMQRWLRFAVGRDERAGEVEGAARDLRWVVDRVKELVPAPELRDLVADCIALRVRWTLSAGGMSRTLARFPERALYLQRTPPKRRFGVASLLRKPLPPPVRLSRSAAIELIDVARGTLAVREREADPVTYADPREVTLFRLERGIDIALFGHEPRRRLPIESYFGYVAARNRVPVAYGGAWILDRRAEVGVHLFETFRGGESAYLFGQILRTYRLHYDVDRFQVDPYQFGADNPEAIRSGAFWFYHRFGFRPRDPELRDLAAREWAAIQADRAHRTSAAVLRRFTNSSLVLDLERDSADRGRLDSTRLGAAITESIRARFGADRASAQRWAVRRVAGLLSATSRRAWPEDERRAFEALCPLMAIIPGLDGWSWRDRTALLGVMRAKGGSQERAFVQRVQRHRRLRDGLRAVEAAVEWDGLPSRPKSRPS